MKKATKKEWTKLMIEIDLQSQSGSIWTNEKSELQKEEKRVVYELPDFGSVSLKPDPVYYNGKIVDAFSPQIID
ncbi:hypothetical protein [Epilithonimonas hominis]|uniref:hypothetical protein n=1 Tax=Epilithonimonas hominis TaxID=420404 RepID=UPI00289990E2|nr:hypothetical protein [Epilithonimonas hominis]